MKRFSIIVIAIIATLLVSCNIDATDGIYSEAAASTESTAVTIRSYLGQNANGAYYYLTDEGIFSIDYATKQSKTLFSNQDGKIIRAASLLDDGSLLILRQYSDPKDGARISYHKYDNGVYADAVLIDGNYNDLLLNGLFYSTNGSGKNIYRYSGTGTAATPLLDDNTAIKDIKALVNGDYAFFQIEDAAGAFKVYVFTSDGTEAVAGIGNANLANPTYCGGFQAVDDSTYAILYRQPSSSKLNVYTMTATAVSEDPAVTVDYSNNESPSFLFDGCVYVKDANSFKKINTTEKTSEQITTGFASNLRTAEITNILPAKDENGAVIAGVFIAGTKASMLYKIDMNGNTSTQIK